MQKAVLGGKFDVAEPGAHPAAESIVVTRWQRRRELKVSSRSVIEVYSDLARRLGSGRRIRKAGLRRQAPQTVPAEPQPKSVETAILHEVRPCPYPFEYNHILPPSTK
jgi:hypothetical protein